MIGLGSGVRRTVAAVAAVSLLAGCAHVRPANPTAVRVDLDDVNSRLADRMARVRLLDDTVLVAHHVRVSADSVYFRSQEPPHPGSPGSRRVVQALPTSEVRSIEVTRRGRGALDGALIGVVAGSLLGTVVGIGMYASEEDPSLWEGVGAFMGAAAVGALGIGTGLAIGAGVGSTEVFDLTRAP